MWKIHRCPCNVIVARCFCRRSIQQQHTHTQLTQLSLNCVRGRTRWWQALADRRGSRGVRGAFVAFKLFDGLLVYLGARDTLSCEYLCVYMCICMYYEFEDCFYFYMKRVHSSLVACLHHFASVSTFAFVLFLNFFKNILLYSEQGIVNLQFLSFSP